MQRYLNALTAICGLVFFVGLFGGVKEYREEDANKGAAIEGLEEEKDEAESSTKRAQYAPIGSYPDEEYDLGRYASAYGYEDDDLLLQQVR